MRGKLKIWRNEKGLIVARYDCGETWAYEAEACTVVHAVNGCAELVSYYGHALPIEQVYPDGSNDFRACHMGVH